MRHIAQAKTQNLVIVFGSLMVLMTIALIVTVPAVMIVYADPEELKWYGTVVLIPIVGLIGALIKAWPIAAEWLRKQSEAAEKVHQTAEAVKQVEKQVNGNLTTRLDAANEPLLTMMAEMQTSQNATNSEFRRRFERGDQAFVEIRAQQSEILSTLRKITHCEVKQQ